LAVIEKKLLIEPYFMVINWSITVSLGVINLFGGTLSGGADSSGFCRSATISQAKIRAVGFGSPLRTKATMFPPTLVFARKSGQKFYWGFIKY
jgi:hypothetical protein